MDYLKLSEILFPEVEHTPGYYIKKYPKRTLPPGAQVTRFAPSPTGFLHIGGVFSAMMSMLIARRSGGVFYLRIEDTDKKREVEGGVEGIIAGLKKFGIDYDEGMISGTQSVGQYGPYKQSERMDIYKTFVKELVRQGKAYPCFCTADEIEVIRESQKDSKQNIGYYGEFAKCRNLSLEEIEQNLKANKPFVLRFKCPYTENDTVKVCDLVRGEREIPQNIQDVVILKSNGLPPYNFAHAVDDFLMGTTVVLRGDEWLASLSEHLQLFEALGVNPPQYAHIAPIQKADENGNRSKLSKRRGEANIMYFVEQGYPKEAVIDYLMTLANSGFEEFRVANPTADFKDFDFRVDKINSSGALFDFDKLNDVSKNIISRFSAKKVYDMALEWAEEYNPDFSALLKKYPDYCVEVFNIDREIPQPRKDIAKFSDIPSTYSYMFDETFEPNIEDLGKFKKDDVIKVLDLYPQYFNIENQSLWFDKIKDLSEQIGFAREVKMFKKEPEKYPGHCGDVSMMLRVALTGRSMTANLYDICRLLGHDRIVQRLQNTKQLLNK